MTAGRCFTRKQAQIDRLRLALENHRHGQWLKRPEASIREIEPWVREVLGGDPERGVLTTVETETKYSGYIGQQERQISRLKTSEARSIPRNSSFGRSPVFPARSGTNWSASAPPPSARPPAFPV